MEEFPLYISLDYHKYRHLYIGVDYWKYKHLYIGIDYRKYRCCCFLHFSFLLNFYYDRNLTYI